MRREERMPSPERRKMHDFTSPSSSISGRSTFLPRMASSTPTIYPGPSPLPGYTVQPLWFRSEPFIEDARADVDDMLAAFEAAWETRPQDQSPFQVFRQAWRQQGWDRVHLAIVDATLRPEWIDSMAKLMLGGFSNPTHYGLWTLTRSFFLHRTTCARLGTAVATDRRSLCHLHFLDVTAARHPKDNRAPAFQDRSRCVYEL
jgi:hypothetical protein